MQTNTTDDLERSLCRVAVDAHSRLDRRSEPALFDAENDTSLLAEIELEETVKELVYDACIRGEEPVSVYLSEFGESCESRAGRSGEEEPALGALLLLVDT